MDKEQKLKNIVKDRYAKIAEQDNVEKYSCCGSSTSKNKVYNNMMDDYSKTDGYVKDADYGLGCGLPTQFAKISKGDTVIDLGSGAGNDCFVARHETGSEGKVIGIDFTPIMIEKARINADKLAYNNVEFREGDIDDMPVGNQTADVVVSNCVLNLVPDKKKVIAEIARILKPGGHFSISDIVLDGDLPDALRQGAEMYAGCVAGAIQKTEYLLLIEDENFQNISVQKVKPIAIPADILSKYLSSAEVKEFNNGGSGIFSITVYAEKPGTYSQETKTDITKSSGCCCC